MSRLRTASWASPLRPPRRSPSAALALAAAALLLAACGGSESPAAPELPRPERVVLVTIDTLRADHLPSYGAPRMTAPFLDELARAGVVFENCIATSSHTGPSHASMFTSLLPAEHELLRNGERLASDVLTLAELFQEQGYETAAFTSVKFLKTLRRHFDHFEAMQVRRRDQTGRKVVDAALAWLEGRAPETRSFLWLHLYDLHAWSEANPAYEHFGPESDADTLEDEDFLRFLGERHRRVAGDPRAEGRRIRYINSYDSRIHYVDGMLRELYQRSEAARAPQQTSLWIVTSDHGEGLGNHGYMGHGRHLYDEQLRVPLLYRFSGGEPGGHRVSSLVRGLDLLPTLAELIGAPLPAQSPPLRGRSYAALLGDPGRQDGPRLAFAQRRPVDAGRLEAGWEPGDVFSLQDGRYKYIHRSEGGDELYDLAEDPGETRSLIGAGLRIEEELRRELLARLDETRGRRDSAAPARIKTEFEEELRALGYLQ